MVWIEEELPARIGLAVLSNAKILFDREKLVQVKPGAMLPAFLEGPKLAN